jgi:hypothetical protein
MAKESIAVPAKVRDAAKKGLELHEQFGRGGTDVGVAMAHKLSSGKALSLEDLRHVSQYFPRHAGDNLKEDGSDGKAPSKGYIAWLLWGGDAGREWSESHAEKAEA